MILNGSESCCIWIWTQDFPSFEKGYPVYLKNERLWRRPVIAPYSLRPIGRRKERRSRRRAFKNWLYSLAAFHREKKLAEMRWSWKKNTRTILNRSGICSHGLENRALYLSSATYPSHSTSKSPLILFAVTLSILFKRVQSELYQFQAHGNKLQRGQTYKGVINDALLDSLWDDTDQSIKRKRQRFCRNVRAGGKWKRLEPGVLIGLAH